MKQILAKFVVRVWRLEALPPVYFGGGVAGFASTVLLYCVWILFVGLWRNAFSSIPRLIAHSLYTHVLFWGHFVGEVGSFSNIRVHKTSNIL